MKKLFLLLSITIISLASIAQGSPWKPSSFQYVAITAKDTVVSGDTIYLKPGANIVAPYADSLAAIKFYLPAVATIHDGAVFHVTVTKKIATVTYLNGTTKSLPTAIAITIANNTVFNGKIVANGSFSLIYRKHNATWYRYE